MLLRFVWTLRVACIFDGLDWLCDAKLLYLFVLFIGAVWTVCIVWMVILNLGFVSAVWMVCIVLIVCIGFWKTLDSLDCLYCFLCWVGLHAAFRLWICLECWIVLVVWITSLIGLVSFDCLNWLCDAWAVSFVYTVSWICLGRLGCVCCPDCYFC